MSKITFKYRSTPANAKKYGEGYRFPTITKKEFNAFNSNILGLGDLTSGGGYVQALSAMLDLQGFTDFCNQVDSHIVIPEFMDKYLNWMFEKLKTISVAEEKESDIQLWNELPFYAKFLGDGVLLLWDTTKLTKNWNSLFNVVYGLLNITEAYKKEFYPEIKKHVSKPPHILRCGVARGQIISIGNGEDYVGSCINIAARLQKIPALSFATSRRGFPFTKSKDHPLNKLLIPKMYKIRGVGEDELIYILKDEYEGLTSSEKNFFTKI
jgi:hypothetical protein